MLSAGFYFGCVHRRHIDTRKDGWTFEFSYILLRCRVCAGLVERLECNGQPVPLPAFPDVKPGEENRAQSSYILMETPVATFRVLPHSDRWHFVGDGHGRWQSEGSIAPGAVERGYYEVDPASNEYSHTALGARQGTPAHWCFVYGWNHCRWVDPTLLDKLPW